jgi:hypothetical protein
MIIAKNDTILFVFIALSPKIYCSTLFAEH